MEREVVGLAMDVDEGANPMADGAEMATAVAAMRAIADFILFLM